MQAYPGYGYRQEAYMYVEEDKKYMTDEYSNGSSMQMMRPSEWNHSPPRHHHLPSHSGGHDHMKHGKESYWDSDKEEHHNYKHDGWKMDKPSHGGKKHDEGHKPSHGGKKHDEGHKFAEDMLHMLDAGRRGNHHHSETAGVTQPVTYYGDDRVRCPAGPYPYPSERKEEMHYWAPRGIDD